MSTTLAGMETDRDWRIRMAAFNALATLTTRHGPVLSYPLVSRGFEFEGEQVFFMSRGEGIFQPRQMDSALSAFKSPPSKRKGRSPLRSSSSFAHRPRDFLRRRNRILVLPDADQRRARHAYRRSPAASFAPLLLPKKGEELGAFVSFGRGMAACRTSPSPDSCREAGPDVLQMRFHRHDEPGWEP